MSNGKNTHEQDIAEFNRKFGLMVGHKPQHLTQRKLKERIECMLEELTEFADASGLEFQTQHDEDQIAPDKINISVRRLQGRLADQADALVDLVYFAIGTAVMMGLPWQALWDDVQRANMEKVPGPTKRGHRRDLMKPPGWRGPDGAVILAGSGYQWIDFAGAHSADIDEARCADDVLPEEPTDAEMEP